MKRFFTRIYFFLVVLVFSCFSLVGYALAEETVPIWTSNYGSAPIVIEKGSVLDIIISASGGSNTSISCSDCTAIKLTDNGNGTARVYWDTKNPPFDVGGPYTINVSATNKKDTSKINWAVMNFTIVEPSTAALKWTSGFTTINANYGSTFDITISATGGNDTQISCENCTLVKLTDNGNGTARVFWNTATVVDLVPGSYYINLKASSKSKPTNFITGSLELYVQVPAPAAGAPQWTSSFLETIWLKPGEVSSIKLTATGGAETGFDCPNCQYAILTDNGNGTADLIWDSKKNIGLASGKYVVNVRTFVKKDPAKVTLGVINYYYGDTPKPFGSGSNEPQNFGTTTPADSITSEYLVGRYPRPEGYTGPLPDCAFSGTCRSTSDLVILLINAAKFLFSIIGVVAFAAFIYGGFMMIFSFGNSEKVGQGKDAMVAAVVGLIIAFSAYMVINFVLNSLGVAAEFKGIIN